MTISLDLFKAVLALDSYSRGYNYAVDVGRGAAAESAGIHIGDAQIVSNSCFK